LGGSSWTVGLGRRDSTTASKDAATTDIPSPQLDLSDLITAFSNKGFSTKEMVVLSGNGEYADFSDVFWYLIIQSRLNGFFDQKFQESTISTFEKLFQLYQNNTCVSI